MCVHFYQNPNLSEISTFKIIFRIFKKIYQVWSALLSILNIYVGVSDTESYIRLKKWIIEMFVTFYFTSFHDIEMSQVYFPIFLNNTYDFDFQ